MITTFIVIMIFCLIAIFLPIATYVLVPLLYILVIVTLANLGTATYLMLQMINKMIEEFFKQYEQQH